MNTFRNCAKRFQRDESGATAIEYGLIMGLMAVALIGAIGATGSSTGDKWRLGHYPTPRAWTDRDAVGPILLR